MKSTHLLQRRNAWQPSRCQSAIPTDQQLRPCTVHRLPGSILVHWRTFHSLELSGSHHKQHACSNTSTHTPSYLLQRRMPLCYSLRTYQRVISVESGSCCYAAAAILYQNLSLSCSGFNDSRCQWLSSPADISEIYAVVSCSETGIKNVLLGMYESRCN